MMESPQTQSEISIHQLVVGKPANDGNIPAQCELLRCSLQEGMDILLWRGHFARPETLQLHDDLGRINFSCILEGTSRFAIQGLRRHTDWELARNRHYITHTPDCRGSASYCGRFESITLSFSPETLALWVPDISAVIKNKIDSHCCCQQQRCNAETHLTAQALRHALMRMHGGFSHEQKPSTLWLQGQSLVMLSLVLDEHREDASCLSCHFNPMERQKLLRAKDLLLVTLGQEMLTSIMSTPAAESFSHMTPYSSGVLPEMLAITARSCFLSSGSSSAIKASTPGFWRPTELRMPMGVSAMRGGGLPSRRQRVRPLQQMPPSSLKS